MNDLVFRRVWNSCGDVQEAANLLVAKRIFSDPVEALARVAARFAVYERHLVFAPFPPRCLYDVKNFSDATGIVPERVDTSRWSDGYKAWKGLIGHGAQLRQAIARERGQSAS